MTAAAAHPTFHIGPEHPGDAAAIDDLLDRAFGPGRRTKTSYRLREGNAAVPGTSFVARDAAGRLVGAISFWPLKVGRSGAPALLLGPLAVDPGRQNEGIGLALMKTGLAAVTAQGHGLVILVGDAPYYARVGFVPVAEGQMQLPGPFNPARLLALELKDGALAAASGLVVPPHRHGL